MARAHPGYVALVTLTSGPEVYGSGADSWRRMTRWQARLCQQLQRKFPGMFRGIARAWFSEAHADGKRPHLHLLFVGLKRRFLPYRSLHVWWARATGSQQERTHVDVKWVSTAGGARYAAKYVTKSHEINADLMESLQDQRIRTAGFTPGYRTLRKHEWPWIVIRCEEAPDEAAGPEEWPDLIERWRAMKAIVDRAREHARARGLGRLEGLTTD